MYGNEVITGLTTMLDFMDRARTQIPDWNDPHEVRVRNHKGKDKPPGLYSLMHPGNDHVTKEIISKIKKAQHFHIDNALIDVEGFLKTEFKVEPFTEEMAVDVNLPYPLCWIDYDHVSEDGDVVKKGVIVESFPYNGYTFLRCLYAGTTDIISNQVGWASMPMVMIVKVGGGLTADDLIHFSTIENSNYKIHNDLDAMAKELIELSLNDTFEGIRNSFFIPICKRDYSELSSYDQEFYEISESCLALTMIVVNMFLLTLNCKNIVTVDKFHRKKVKLGRKTKYVDVKNKFQYKTLEIILPKTKKSSSSGSGTGLGESKKVHFCMGSYATYTEENPLFGHKEGRKPITGRFWRQGSLKGSKEKGVVIKEYVAKPKKKKKSEEKELNP